MREEIPSMVLALKVWWAFTWRAVLFGTLLSLPLSFVMGFIGALVGIPKVTIALLTGLFGFILGLCTTIWVIHRMMTKGFGKYRLVVVNK